MNKTSVREHGRKKRKGGKIRISRHERNLPESLLSQDSKNYSKSDRVKRVSEFEDKEWNLETDEGKIKKLNEEFGNNYDFYFTAETTDKIDKLFGGYGIPFLYSDAYKVL